MIRWKPARNAKLPSSDDLRKALADAQAHVADLAGEAKIVQDDMPNHLGTARYGEAQAALANLEAELAVARRTVDALQDGIAKAEAREAAEREAAIKAEADRRHEEVATKVVAAHKKVTLKIEALITELAAACAESDDLLAQIEAANAIRGSRPMIVDGEMQLRGKPGRTEAAVVEEKELWVDGAGNSPMQYRRLPSGEDVPVELGYEKKRVRVQVRGERVIAPSMPTRYSKALTLVAPAGHALKI